MGAKSGNQNAAKEGGPRVPACLSIADEKKKRKSWAIRKIYERDGIEDPTPQQISRFVKDWCYARIDEDIARG